MLQNIISGKYGKLKSMMDFNLLRLQVYIVQTVTLLQTDLATDFFSEHVLNNRCLTNNILRKLSML